jgi:hypothetical protein
VITKDQQLLLQKLKVLIKLLEDIIHAVGDLRIIILGGFIFSLNQNNLINSIIISKENHYESKKSNYIGPCGSEFGSDLILLLSDNENTNKGRCCRNNYEKRIRNNDETEFEIEEYEVFQVYKTFQLKNLYNLRLCG